MSEINSASLIVTQFSSNEISVQVLNSSTDLTEEIANLLKAERSRIDRNLWSHLFDVIAQSTC